MARHERYALSQAHFHLLRPLASPTPQIQPQVFHFHFNFALVAIPQGPTTGIEPLWAGIITLIVADNYQLGVGAVHRFPIKMPIITQKNSNNIDDDDK